MIRTFVGLLIVLWLVGIATSYTLGGFIHLLPLVALLFLVIELLGRRKLA